MESKEANRIIKEVNRIIAEYMGYKFKGKFDFHIGDNKAWYISDKGSEANIYTPAYSNDLNSMVPVWEKISTEQSMTIRFGQSNLMRFNWCELLMGSKKSCDWEHEIEGYNMGSITEAAAIATAKAIEALNE